MNKDFKVFQLHGLSGLLLLGCMAVGLFCGFVLFPIWVIMIGWNEFAANMLGTPVINYYQSSLLWVFFALCSYLVLRNSVSIKVQKGVEEDDFDLEIEDIIEKSIPDDKDGN